jgi:enolase
MCQKSNARARISSIHYRRILNSHLEFTTEFVVELDDGTIGVGSVPKGETRSIYEKVRVSVEDPKRVIDTLLSNHFLKVPLNQVEFDAYLQRRTKILGASNCYALSLAFFDANERSHARLQQGNQIGTKSSFPHICLNVLNGGHHAYTNPVLSDFPEFLLVSRSNLLGEIINEHKELQRRIRENLSKLEKIVVNGNLVNKLSAADNRVWLDFLLEIIEDLNLTSKYDLMIDASAGDLWTGRGYLFSLTDGSLKTSSEMCDYWIDLIDAYKIKFLEDPFQERDFESWINLSRTQGQCNVIGDNLYSSDPIRIQEGASRGYTHGTIIKPDQAGTVTATIKAIKTAHKRNQIVMTSHRSISTESTFLSTVTSRYNVDYIKIGPLITDYSAIVRLNELIRLSGIGYE